MMHDSDKELMIRVVKRNTDAFKILYQRYESPIFNFIFRYTGTKEIAQDLLQETFTRVWLAAHTFDLREGNFKGWIFKIALNTTRNEMSKKRYDCHFSDVGELSGSSDEPAHSESERPDIELEQSELKQTIGDALGRLPPFLREIIILKHYHQLKFREIAQITNTPEGTLKARFHRAIAQLKELLEPMDL